MAGTGKTSIAEIMCKALHAAHVRVDTIEHALLSTLGKDFELKALGYRAAYAIAEDNLRNGLWVVADSVNPWGVTRAAWLRVAARCDVPAVEIEVICSDAAVHEKRLANAKTDAAGVKPPTWSEVMSRHYEPWSRDRIVVDTADKSIEESAEQLLAYLNT
jgi:predicted kinase